MDIINWGFISDGKTFESLANSLILTEIDPHAVPFGRAGRDDAQDIFSPSTSTVYQVKYRKNSSVSDFVSTAKSEALKIQKYVKADDSKNVWKGIKRWVLICNASANPRDHKNWVENVEPIFSEVGIETECLYIEVLEAYLRKNPYLIDSFFNGKSKVFVPMKEMKTANDFCRSSLEVWNNSFVGREKELIVFDEFLKNDANKFFLVHGPGGVGKTRFVVESVERFAFNNGYLALWCLLDSMKHSSSYFTGLVPERKTLLIIDNPDDDSYLKVLSEQMSVSTNNWKAVIVSRSSNDPILKHLNRREGRRLSSIEIAPFSKDEGVTFTRNLLESEFPSSNVDWLSKTSLLISSRFNHYPMWIAISIEILKKNGDLKQLPDNTDQLLEEYVEEVLLFQSTYTAQKLKELFRWVCLLRPFNVENDFMLQIVKNSVPFQNSFEVKKSIKEQVNRKVLFCKGARERFVELKPDILSDFILREWLIIDEVNVNTDMISLASSIIEQLEKSQPSETEAYENVISNLVRCELFFQHTFDKKIDLLSGLTNKIRLKVSEMTLIEQTKLVSVLRKLSPSRIEEVFEIIIDICKKSFLKEEITTSIFFGTAVRKQETVLRNLTLTIRDSAIYITSIQGARLLSKTLYNLAIREFLSGLSSPEEKNDGKSVQKTFERLISGGDDFYFDFSQTSYQLCINILSEFEKDISSTKVKYLVETFVLSFCQVAREQMEFDGKTLTIKRYNLFEEHPQWDFLVLLRNKILEFLKENGSQNNLTILWKVLSRLQGSIIRARPGESADGEDNTITNQLNRLAEENLKGVKNILQHNEQIKAIQSARDVWLWHLKYEKCQSILSLATECEGLFIQKTDYEIYEEIINDFDSDWKIVEEKRKQKANSLAQTNAETINEFFERGYVYAGNPEKFQNVIQVAYPLGLNARNVSEVREFIQSGMLLPTDNPIYKAAIVASKAWLNSTRSENISYTTELLEKIILLCKDDFVKVVDVLSNFYRSSWLIDKDAGELELIFKYKDAFVIRDRIDSLLYVASGMHSFDFPLYAQEFDNLIKDLSNSEKISLMNKIIQPFFYRLDRDNKNDSNTVKESGRWIVTQITNLPDMDGVLSESEWYIEKILDIVGKFNLDWLVSVIEKRLALFQADESISTMPFLNSITLLVEIPKGNELSKFKTSIENIIRYSIQDSSLSFSLSQEVAKIDPAGDLVPEIISEFVSETDLSMDETYLLSKIAGHYDVNSSPWRKIALHILEQTKDYSNKEKNSIFHAFTKSMKGPWSSPIGKVASLFYSNVEKAEKYLENETEDLLIPFWEWFLRSAKSDLKREEEDSMDDWV